MRRAWNISRSNGWIQKTGRKDFMNQISKIPEESFYGVDFVSKGSKVSLNRSTIELLIKAPLKGATASDILHV